MRVLVVEDDPADLRLLRRAVATDGRASLQLEHVDDLAGACARLLQEPPIDVALVDLTLAESSGLDTLATMLAVERPVPVVVLTGSDDDELARRAVEAGAQDYLVKGTVTAEVVGRALRSAIERDRLQATLRERVKELRGLVRISRGLQEDDSPCDVARRVADILVEAMQWPHVCRAEVAIDDVVATAGAPGEVRSTLLTAAIEVGGDERGHLRVGYVEEGRWFLVPEEQQLLDSAADQVAGWLGRYESTGRLRQEEERLRLLVSQLPGIVWTADAELRVTSCSGALLHELAPNGEELVGADVESLLGPDAATWLATALAGDAGVSVGQWRDRWWRNHLEPRRDRSGAIVGVVCLSLDVTREHEQRSELDAMTDRLAGLFANTLDALLLAGDDGRLVDANPAAMALTGRTHAELVGCSVRDLLGGAPSADTQWRTFRADGAMGGDVTIVRPDGTTREAEFRAVTDIVPGLHLSSLRDVTDRKAAQTALARSQERFRALAESSQDAIYRLRCAPEVTFEYLNPAVADITGFPVEDFYDRPALFLDRLHPEDSIGWHPGKAPETVPLTVRFQRADGEWIWLEDRRSTVEEGGRSVGLQGVIRDVTAREQARRALQRALQAERAAAEELRAVDRMKTGFLQAMSHELRTPLTSVVGYADTLVQRADQLSPDQVRSFHERLARNAARLDALIGDLLDLQRLGDGSVAIEPEATDLSALARGVVDRLDLSQHRCSVVGAPVIANVDPRQIERVLAFLLANAVKHTPPGTSIAVSCRGDEQGATIEIADDGPGIPLDQLPHVFESFWQGPQMQGAASPGTGIGLALVRELVRLHGGSIRAGSTPERGARFTVWLPADGPGTGGPGGSPVDRAADLSSAT